MSSLIDELPAAVRRKLIPPKIFIVGFRKDELDRLISILGDEKDRLETRRSTCTNVQLAVDLTEDIAEIQAHIEKLEHIAAGEGPSILDDQVRS